MTLDFGNIFAGCGVTGREGSGVVEGLSSAGLRFRMMRSISRKRPIPPTFLPNISLSCS